MILNCNVTREDFICAEEIFGHNLGSLKGKTTIQPNEHVCITWTAKEIINNYGEVTLAIDIMEINKIMVTTSKNIHFGMAERIQNKTKNMIMKSISQVVQAHKARDFQVCNILADGVFKYIRGRLSEIVIALHVTSRNEHVPEVEHYIKPVKKE